MARIDFLKTKKAKIVISFLLILAIGLSLYFTLRPNDEKKNNSKDPTFSYSQVDNSLGELSNSSFAYGTIGVKYSSFPRTSLTGWKLTKDSSAKSGVVNTYEKTDGQGKIIESAWEKLLTSFYGDPGILEYVKAKEGLTDVSAIQRKTKEYLKEENPDLSDDYTPSADDVKNFFAKKLFPDYFPNPGVHAGEHTQKQDSMIYMLNNYKTGEVGSGSVQKLTSSKEITLNKGQYAKVSVWVKTLNLDQLSETSGANVYVTNTFDSAPQAPYGYFNIDTNGEWKKYSFILEADDVYTTKFTLVLGLGFGDVYSEGTVYFDDIMVEHLEDLSKQTTSDSSNTTFEYGSDAEYISVTNNLLPGIIPKHSLNLDFTKAAGNNYFKNLGFDDSASNFTTDVSVSGVSGARFGNTDAAHKTPLVQGNPLIEDAPAASATQYSLKYASYTAKFNAVELGCEEYAYVSFFIKNKLNTFYATTITVNVIDIYTVDGKSTSNTRSRIIELTSPSDTWENCGILIQNNFDKDVYSTSGTRSFVIEVIMGPTSLASTNVVDYAYGDVYITTPEVAKGVTYKYATDYDEENDIQTANYKFYQFLNESARGFASLYTGYESDYLAPGADAESQYSIAVAPSSIGAIYTRPATPSAYKGIVSDHYYLDENSKNHEIDASKYAGVVNTEYLSSYSTTDFPEITSALTKVNNEHVQPLMIYNNAETSYGYLSDNYTLGSSSNAKISLRVRVYGNATAYIYLIDTASASKSVMTFKNFTVNTDDYLDSAENGTAINGESLKLQLSVTESMMESDGWATITFYVAAGVNAKSFRLEMWNGSRDGESASKGYVFFDNILVTTASGFTEPTSLSDTFTVAGSPLYEIGYEDLDQLYSYAGEDKDPSYVWAKNDTTIYAVYNTLEPVVIPDAETDEESETTTETVTNPADFWLQLSSILLIVALIVAIAALFIKNFLRRRKANKSDAKSHYKVVSRTKAKEKSKAKPVENFDKEFENFMKENEIVEEQAEEQTNEQVEEQTLDSYVYGEVQSFGDETEEVKSESDEKTEE